MDPGKKWVLGVPGDRGPAVRAFTTEGTEGHGENLKLANNRDLYEYLLSLARVLKNRGAENLAQAVLSASGHFAGMSTEFLGESRIALRKVVRVEHGLLNKAESTELVEILKQIDSAFEQR